MAQTTASGKIKARLYINEPGLAEGRLIQLEENPSRYLGATLRAKAGDRVAVFNGVDGQWLAEITDIAKRGVQVRMVARHKAQKSSPPIGLLFAPVKNDKIDFLVKRAVELGVSRLQPVMTQRTVVSRVNMERLQANAVEAAEQCERLDIPALHPPQPLLQVLSAWNPEHIILYCDEQGQGTALKALLPTLPVGRHYTVLTGPEGGFSDEERRILRKLPYIRGISLGPRILRAETAALAALACVQAWLGDWDEQPAFE